MVGWKGDTESAGEGVATRCLGLLSATCAQLLVRLMCGSP